jgi:hypothetical protein
VLGDRGYDHDKYRRLGRALGVKPMIARRGTEQALDSEPNAGLSSAPSPTCTGSAACGSAGKIRDDIHEAFLTLGCALICWRRLSQHV